jgi:hypothetical protein
MSDLETAVRERLIREGKSPEEIEAEIQRLRSGQGSGPGTPRRPRYEYKSQASLLGIPLVHVVIGRDPETGRVGKALGIVAIGRMAFGVLAIGQLAVGVFPLGQLALGVVAGMGQAVFAGYDAIGQLAVGSHFALGQFAVAASAIGQLAVGRYVIAQIGWGRYVWSTKIKDPEALEHFREMFHWVFDWLA